MRLYQKGERLYFAHKATMTLNLISSSMVNKVTLYDKLPEGWNPEDFHRVSIEVVKTKKEMRKMKSRMLKAQAEREAKGTP